MIHITSFFLASLVVTVSGVAQRACPSGWAQRGQSCYQLFDKHMNFHDGPAHYLSGRFCNDIGAYLAEITTQEENDFVKTWLARKLYTHKPEGVWIGGAIPHDGTDWLWKTSHKNLIYTDWFLDQDTQPGKCLSMSPKFNYSWVPEYCSKTLNMKYVCEKYVCDLASRCFQGSCYSLNCGTYRAKTSTMDQYDKDAREENRPCPEGYLAQIETKEEGEFIKTFLEDADTVVNIVWTGGHQLGLDQWTWGQSGEIISDFTDWAKRPDVEDDLLFDPICIGLSRADGWAWRKLECDSLRPALCERPDTSFLG